MRQWLAATTKDSPGRKAEGFLGATETFGLNLLRKPYSGNTDDLVRSAMSPRLAYGRHRGPAARNARLAAVAVVLFHEPAGPTADGLSQTPPDLSDWRLILTVRPATLRHHAGQVCFPGGRLEVGETVATAARREFTEELGRPPDEAEICGVMSPQYVFASNHLVYPVVMIADAPTKPWIPEPGEVAEVITLSISEAKREIQSAGTNVHITRSVLQKGTKCPPSQQFSAPAISAGNHTVWGMTAMVINELVDLIEGRI